LSWISSLLLPAGLLFAQQKFVAEKFIAEKFVAEEPHMGTVFQITAYADDAQAGIRAAFDRVAELDGKLSDYQPDSELMRLCRSPFGHPVPVSADLFAVLRAAQQLAIDSDGAFDVTIGPVTRLWRLKRVPDREERERALRLVGYRNVVLREGTVELKLSGMQLDLGAIAKGYAADEALRVLRSRGITRALVAASGDLAIGDAPPGKPGWKVSIQPLDIRRELLLSNISVGTSGDTEQFLETAGTRYSHIVDPRTGLGLTQRIGVTVIAPSGLEADGLGTTLSVVTAQRGVEAGLALVERRRGAAALIVTKDGARASSRFAGFDFVPAAKEHGNHEQDRKRGEAGADPEASPVAAGGGGEVIDRGARNQRANKHADAVGHERDEALRGAAQFRGRFLIGIKLAGHEEEVVADAVQKDRQIKHPHARIRIAVREERVAE
jgi:thiamine biosynthesis lipoprotein